MSIRCASCGSGKVSVDTKSEGFSVGKAVVGTALFGTVGAVMGVNGKQKKYYHCADCGMTLSYSLPTKISCDIDLCILRPEENIVSLEVYKKTYPNIEWEKAIEQNNVEKTPIKKRAKEYVLSPSVLADEIYKYCVEENKFYLECSDAQKSVMQRHYDIYKDYGNRCKFHNKIGTYSEHRIDKDFEEAFDILVDKGLAKVDNKNDEHYISIYVDPDKIKRNIREAEDHLLFRSGRMYCNKKLLSIIDIENPIINSDVYKALAEIFINDGLVDNEESAYYIAKMTCDEAQRKDFNISKASISVSTVLQNFERRQNEEIAKKEKAVRITEEILKVFTDDTQFLSLDEIRERNENLLNCNSLSNDITQIARYGELEFKTTENGLVFGLPGSLEKSWEIELEERKEAEQREKERKRQEIRNQISKLEKEKSENEKIYAENKGKIFGAGAKAKKSAQMRIAELETQINSLKSKL